MYRLENPVRSYAWGSRTALAELLGRPAPDGGPEAELWLGAHPDAASRVRHEDGATTPLPVLIAGDPAAMLGPAAGLHQGRLPFLLKVLAVDRPLSLQVHPDGETARAGHAAQSGAADASARLAFSDPFGKPELICALTPFRALVGLRPVPELVALLRETAIPELKAAADDLGRGQDGAVVRRLVGSVLRTPDPGGLVGQVVDAARRLGADGPWTSAYRCVLDLAERHPADPGVVVALLMNQVDLEPGQAVFLPPGRLHAYLSGVGIEAMACSDNVLRGGLTSKAVDVDGLLGALDPEPAAVVLTAAQDSGDGWSTYPVPVPEFELARAEINGPAVSGTAGPQVLLVLHGSAAVTAGRRRVELARGQSVFVPAGRSVTLDGRAGVVRATSGRR